MAKTKRKHLAALAAKLEQQHTKDGKEGGAAPKGEERSVSGQDAGPSEDVSKLQEDPTVEIRRQRIIFKIPALPVNTETHTQYQRNTKKPFLFKKKSYPPLDPGLECSLADDAKISKVILKLEEWRRGKKAGEMQPPVAKVSAYCKPSRKRMSLLAFSRNEIKVQRVVVKIPSQSMVRSSEKACGSQEDTRCILNGTVDFQVHSQEELRESPIETPSTFQGTESAVKEDTTNAGLSAVKVDTTNAGLSAVKEEMTNVGLEFLRKRKRYTATKEPLTSAAPKDDSYLHEAQLDVQDRRTEGVGNATSCKEVSLETSKQLEDRQHHKLEVDSTPLESPSKKRMSSEAATQIPPHCDLEDEVNSHHDVQETNDMWSKRELLKSTVMQNNELALHNDCTSLQLVEMNANGKEISDDDDLLGSTAFTHDKRLLLGIIKKREERSVEQSTRNLEKEIAVGVSGAWRQKHQLKTLKRQLHTAGGLNKWLQVKGLDQFRFIFEENMVEEITLLKLTMSGLKEMGIHAVGPRRKLISAINDVVQSSVL